jgi:hypothetical protein
VIPDATSTYVIIASEGREHVNEGAAQGGGASTVTLNSDASNSDNAYNGQVIFLRSGTGDDQARIITDYNGTTKVATVSSVWDVQPVAGTGYVMLPTGFLPKDYIPVIARKNTALANFAFVMTDSTNHETATGLTVTCTRSIDGGAFAPGTLANVSEISNGIYNVDFLAADLNGDVIVLRAAATGCDDTFVTIVTSK